MDKDITMERLIADLEEVISQINDIVKRKDVAAAKKAMEQIDDVDCILFVVDGKKGIGPGDKYILNVLNIDLF